MQSEIHIGKSKRLPLSTINLANWSITVDSDKIPLHKHFRIPTPMIICLMTTWPYQTTAMRVPSSTWTPFPSVPWIFTTWQISHAQSLWNSDWAHRHPVTATPSRRLFVRTFFVSAFLQSNSLPHPIVFLLPSLAIYHVWFPGLEYWCVYSVSWFCLCLYLPVCTSVTSACPRLWLQPDDLVLLFVGLL